MLLWKYECDGAGCKSTDAIAAFKGLPPGWLLRTIIDRVDSLDEPATGSGLPSSRCELQREKHYCPTCRRKVASAA